MSIEPNHIISPGPQQLGLGPDSPDDKVPAIAPGHPVVRITDAR